MTTARPSRVGAIVVLVLALVSLAQHPPSTHAQGSTDNVQRIDLAKMVLPLSAFGPDYAGSLKRFESRFTAGNKPTTTGYKLAFVRADGDAARSAPVGSEVDLFSSVSDASNFLSILTGHLPAIIDPTRFPVPGLTDAVGVSVTRGIGQGPTFLETLVLFRRDRLLGAVLIARADNTKVASDAIAAATALDQRIKGVLTRKVTDFPAPLPPDVNCDGVVNSIDASLLLQLGAGLVASLPCDALADANRDGVTNAVDVSLILQYDAGLIHELPV